MVAVRDDVLREEVRVKIRARLWDVVKGSLEGNANMRTMFQEGRNGEVSRVREWTGTVQRIGGNVGSANIRRSVERTAKSRIFPSTGHIQLSDTSPHSYTTPLQQIRSSNLKPYQYSLGPIGTMYPLQCSSVAASLNLLIVPLTPLSSTDQSPV